jgi:hypothetical protein
VWCWESAERKLSEAESDKHVVYYIGTINIEGKELEEKYNIE